MVGTANTNKEAATTDAGAKALGAFYTDAQIADFLVWWAVRQPQDTVLDPSFGGGVFLRSACKRFLHLGCQPATRVFGVEVDAQIHRSIAGELGNEFGIPGANLFLADFFSLGTGLFPGTGLEIDVIVGNPPFIRYQRFSGTARRLALGRCEDHGVRLPELCSSWAPFLVHSVAMLQPGGRLAMVVPMEIAHAAYARPVLRQLQQSFAAVTFLTFRRKLFPDLSEDTLLLLADDKGGPSSGFLCRDMHHAGLLMELQQQSRQLAGTRRMDAGAIAAGQARLIEYLIPRKARELYRELNGAPRTRQLGEVADVGIGYVTGANDFFHLAPQDADRRGIPRRFLRPAIRRGRALSGLRFSVEDWQQAAANGEAGYLLYIEEDGTVPESVRSYLRQGESQGIPKAYKCRTRSPWYRVPHVHRADAFLSYMSGNVPRLVANDAEAVAPNSLHIVRLYPHAGLTKNAIAALWQTSLTRLSVEIEGHALGGGMLKIEPTEADKVLVPWPQRLDESWLGKLALELDTTVRGPGDEAALARADTTILRDGLGLSRSDCDLLRNAADSLRTRRLSRSARP